VRIFAPTTREEVSEAVRSLPRVHPLGARSKPALSAALDPAHTLDLSGVRGVLDYDPAEFTITALAGTPLAEVSAVLGEHRQHLPFDPPFAGHGATLGGAVASGISGSGRQRYGGVRDFLIGVAMVGGDGAVIRGGGKVVKNAAGFDLPKLMVGSLGTLGALVELTFKVFPQPETYRTLRFEAGGFERAHRIALRLAAAPFDLEALDLEAPDIGISGHARPRAAAPAWHVLVRIGGPADSLLERARRIESFASLEAEPLDGAPDDELWCGVREASWLPEGHRLIRVPIAPTEAPPIEEAVGRCGEDGSTPVRRYAAGCGVLWLAWPPQRSLVELDEVLSSHRLAGQVVRGEAPCGLLGELAGLAFYRRLKRALDPQLRFPDLADLQAPRAAPRDWRAAET